MRVLIIVPAQDPATGNWVTAGRFQAQLKQRGHTVLLLATGLEPAPEFAARIAAFAPDVALLLHAYRSGRPWSQVISAGQTPMIVLLTGTDMNLGLADPAQQTTIRAVMASARFVLLQNRRLLTELGERNPQLCDKLHYLPPGIQLGETPYDLRKAAEAAEKDVLFFCPAGIRPVKGVLELVRLFDRVAAASGDVRLVIAGPVLDEEYARQFLQAVTERPWIHYLGTLPPEAMADAIRGADVIVNNSSAEGLSNALLEAVTLGIPVLANAIPGNTEVIVPGENGLLYTDEESFVEQARRLLTDDSLRRRLGRPDAVRFSPHREAEKLESLLTRAMHGPGDQS